MKDEIIRILGTYLYGRLVYSKVADELINLFTKTIEDSKHKIVKAIYDELPDWFGSTIVSIIKKEVEK
jgi:hypothetical protein